MDKYDLIILGSGSAAFGAAIRAVELGAKVAMVEKGTIGGTCVNVGCVPSKHLLRVGEIGYYKSHGHRGLDISSSIDLAGVISDKREIVENIRKSRYTDVIEPLGIILLRGKAAFISKNEVKVNGKNIQADKFIIATGSSPYILPIEGIDKVDYLTNVEAMELSKLPESMIVIGGRALGLEFAQMFSHFGTKVTVLQRSSRIIPEEESIISDYLKAYLEEEGMNIQINTSLKSVRKEKGNITVTALAGDDTREFEAEKLLIATGRRPNTEDLGLEKAGVSVDKNGAVIVDEEMRTSAPNIWAAGDVLGEPMLETVAGKEGFIAAQNALTGERKKMDLRAVPHAVYTIPQVASVGLTEKKAEEIGITCRCSTISMELVPKAVLTKDTRGLVKMVIEDRTERILGVHILASLAADMIHEGVLAVKYGMTLDDIIDTVHVFPTMTEAVKLVAQSFRRDISKMSCCAE
ncbi:dihydrolipoamide dehydrogenase/mercuric reductase [Candidatus Methanoperedens nitroreducens]|uniref:Dihydrolipoyl dehydrogenase n=1 Tax=Candidatus Methanoperedens nitratireducens TaxID=1392998 RepID=A0A062VB91_9EURY|nr:mercury(II) reductase [Candidatus Methanoperedens nitroreducens]KCZ72929.1 dihydrolipoamide dehydrogenase/mercuric reductase [Candidatus Methanoperedens nitroreducens]MDJ1423143.1 mercury(II) reductase [Candidatus Methanoperedens sp.]